MTRIAIVGAGLSGLVTAQRLNADHEVVVFEKSRGVGGRLATRRAGAWAFDHGAQYFTARSRSFREFLQPAFDAGMLARWDARLVEFDGARSTAAHRSVSRIERYVATPGMNALGKFLADGLELRLEATVAALAAIDRGWRLQDAAGNDLGEFDWVVLSAPAAQTAALLPQDSPLAAVARARRQKACYALMLGFNAPLRLDWDAARIRGACIGWIAVNSSKPGRPTPFALVVHSTNDWADERLEAEPDDVKRPMLDAVSALIGVDAANADHVALHRWRYANIDAQPCASQVDADNRVAACGDWFVSGRVEAAYESAERLAAEFDQLI